MMLWFIFFLFEVKYYVNEELFSSLLWGVVFKSMNSDQVFVDGFQCLKKGENVDVIMVIEILIY